MSTEGLFVTREATYSPCKAYRYTLKIVWDESKPITAFIGLNPSTATEFQDDPTIRRCRGFAESWDCGGLLMLNIFAYRATDPKVMKIQDDPIGIENTVENIRHWLSGCHGPHIAAWGRHGSHMLRGGEVRYAIDSLSCLAINSDGSPKHPLYLLATLTPQPF